MISAHDAMKQGLWWLGGATVVARVIDLCGTFALLFFLTRAEIGLASLSWTVSVVMESVTGLGVGQSLVRAKSISGRERDLMFWFSTLTGSGLGGCLAIAAPFLASFYGNPALTAMILVSAAKLVFVGASIVPSQMLARDLRFRDSGAAQTVSSVSESAIKITLAALGFGAWSLVIANALRAVVLLVLVWRMAPMRPRFSVAFGEITQHISFGGRVAASGALYNLYRNADYLLIGKFLGLDALGVYRVAFDFAMSPLEMTQQIVGRVGFPVYARIASDRTALRQAFLRSSKWLSLTLSLLVSILFAAGPMLLPIFGKERWEAAGPALQILSVAGFVRCLAMLFPQVFHAAGKPELAIYDSLVSFVTLVGGFFVALTIAPHEWGMLGVCWSWLASYPILLLVQLHWSRRCMDLSNRRYLRTVMPGALILAFTTTLMSAAARFLPAPPLFKGSLVIVLGLTTYSLFVRFVLGIRARDLLPNRLSTLPAPDASKSG